MNLPEPLTPHDLDLRDFAYMPLDIGRLFGSQFHAAATDAEWRAGVTLWLKSYHQVPSASIPDDDVALARLAEFGRDTKAWRKVRPAALRGWVKCSDGRLYHPVVAEKALEGWLEKLTQRKSSGSGNAKRWGSEFDAAAIDYAAYVASGMLKALNPQSRSLSKRPQKTSRSHPTGTAGGTPEVIPMQSQEKGRDNDDGTRMRAGSSQISPEAFEIVDALEKVCGFNLPEELPPGWCGGAMWVQKCLNEGWIGDVMINAARGVAIRKKGGFIETFKYLEKPLAQAMADYQTPLPQVQVRQPEKITVTENGNAGSNHRTDPAAGRATARETQQVAAMGRAAANRLASRAPAEPDGEASGSSGSAEVVDLRKRSEGAY